MSTPRPAPWLYFALVFVISVPIWLACSRTDVQLMPGLPLSAVAVVVPATAALILAWRQGGPAGARALLARAVDAGRVRPRSWWLLLVLLAPAALAIAWAAMRLAGRAIPLPAVAAGPSLAMLAIFLVAAVCEELGWSGYAVDPLQARLGALPAALVIGGVWAIWHFVPLLQAHRAPVWIAWWTLGTVATRVIMVWLYNHTGRSVAGEAVFHAMSNLAWQLFPVRGSFYDPAFGAPVLAGIALLAILVSGRRMFRRPATS
ncbi:MAG TPA: CPBP family intramembrane glutamic endopeptidase [Caulobacteraceae bacterium]|nr:CPBP family intramembrane glutamic endopeptidase [Caulobacteraceae bacterium]